LVCHVKDGRRLREFENKKLRRIFGPKRTDLTGGRRKFYNEELHNFHFSPNIIIMIKYWRSDERVMQKMWERKERTQIGKP
jgi:hypothetical protein